MNEKETLKTLKEFNKVLKKTKKAENTYIKSLSKDLEIGLLTLTEIELANEDHVSKLPIIVSQLDNIISQSNKLIEVYRKYL